jgi:hypothetical protein
MWRRMRSFGRRAPEGLAARLDATVPVTPAIGMCMGTLLLDIKD